MCRLLICVLTTLLATRCIASRPVDVSAADAEDVLPVQLMQIGLAVQQAKGGSDSSGAKQLSVSQQSSNATVARQAEEVHFDTPQNIIDETPASSFTAREIASRSAGVSGLYDSMNVAKDIILQWSLVLAGAFMYSIFWPKTASKAEELPTAALSGFRAFLAFWVISEHAGLQPLNGGGAFIVLSGTVLSVSRRGATPGTVKAPVQTVGQYGKFVWLRLWRVLPLLWFFLGTSWFNWFSPFFMSTSPILFLPEVFLNFARQVTKDPTLIFAQGFAVYNSHAWFVGVIVWLYCLYPVIERGVVGPDGGEFCSRARLMAVAGLCIMAKLATILWMLREVQPDAHSFYLWKGIYLYCFPFLRIPEFTLGVLLPHLQVSPQVRPSAGAHDDASTAASDGSDEAQDQVELQLARMMTHLSDFAFLVMVAFAWLAPQSNYSYFWTDFNMQCVLTALVIWGLCFGPAPSVCGRLFNNKYLVRVGEWGYGIYLFHVYILYRMGIFHPRSPPCQQYTEVACGVKHFADAFPGAWVAFAVACILSAALSWSMFRLIEEPCSNWARRMVASPHAEPATVESKGSVNGPPDVARPGPRKEVREQEKTAACVRGLTTTEETR